MRWNRLLLLMLAPALLTACGGGDSDDQDYEDSVSVPYGVIFQVNGVQDATAVTIQQVELNSDNGYAEDCDTDNADDLVGETEYCDDVRNIGIVTFQFRFINNLLRSIPFSFSGVGVTVQIERQTGTDPETWELVWDSDAYLRVQYKIFGLAEYDPNALGLNNVTGAPYTSLAPAEAYPNQDYAALTFRFLTERNFIDDNGNGKFDQDEDRLVALPGTTTAGNLEGSDKCAWVPTLNEGTNKKNMPACQTEELPAGTYRATAHYHFAIDGELADPPPVIITVNPAQ